MAMAQVAGGIKKAVIQAGWVNEAGQTAVGGFKLRIPPL